MAMVKIKILLNNYNNKYINNIHYYNNIFNNNNIIIN